MLAFSILLIVTGAVLRFAVEVTVPGVSLQKVGTILIVTGVVTLALALTLRYADAGNDRIGGRPSQAEPRVAVSAAALPRQYQKD